MKNIEHRISNIEIFNAEFYPFDHFHIQFISVFDIPFFILTRENYLLNVLRQ